MSLANELNSVRYVGNASTTVGYSITFSYLSDTDIHVYLDGVKTSAFTKVGGSVFTTVAQASSVTVTISRTVLLTQDLDLVPSGDMPSSLVENAFDKLTMICQQIYRYFLRCFRVPEGEDGLELPVAATRAGKWWHWNTSTGAYEGQTDAQMAAAVSSELNLAADVATKPTQTTADVSSRAALAPAFTGQLLVQLDTGEVYRGTGLSAGNWSDIDASTVQSVATEALRIAATPVYVGQLLHLTHDKTWWMGIDTAAGSWAKIASAPFSEFSAPSSTAWVHAGSAVDGNFYTLLDARSGLTQTWKCRFGHTMNDGNTGSGGATWNGAADNRPGVYDDTDTAANPDEPYLDGDEVWRNLPGLDLDSGGGEYRGQLWEPWIQEGYHFYRLEHKPGENTGDNWMMGDPANHTDWHLVHDWLIRNAKSARDTMTIDFYAAAAGNRTGRTPGAINEILLQVDTNQMYYAASLTAGDYVFNDQEEPGEWRRIQSGWSIFYPIGTFRTSREIKQVRHTTLMGTEEAQRGQYTIFKWVSGMVAADVLDEVIYRVAARVEGSGSTIDQGSSNFFTVLGKFTVDLAPDPPSATAIGNAISNGMKLYLSHGSIIHPIRLENVGWQEDSGEIYGVQFGSSCDDWRADSIIINAHPNFRDSVAVGGSVTFDNDIHGGSREDGNGSTSTAYTTPTYAAVGDIDVYFDGVLQTYPTHWGVNGADPPQVVTTSIIASSVRVDVVNTKKLHDRGRTIGIDFGNTVYSAVIGTIVADECGYAIRTSGQAVSLKIQAIEVEHSAYLYHALDGCEGVEILGIAFRRDDGRKYGTFPVLDEDTPLANLADINVTQFTLRMQGLCNAHSGVAVNVGRNRVAILTDAAHSVTLAPGTCWLQGLDRARASLCFDWSLKDDCYPGYFVPGPYANNAAAVTAGIPIYGPYRLTSGTDEVLSFVKP